MLVVTGGSGFIGSHLLKTVEGVDFSLKQGLDITDMKQLISKTAGAEAVVHLAAETDASSTDVDKIFSTNVFGTLNVLEACRRNDVKNLVFASSAAVYGDAKPPLSEAVCCEPTNLYGASKLAAESYVSAYSNSYGIDSTVLRFFNVYGSGCHGVVRDFIASALCGRAITILGDGSQTRDFVYVGDVVEAIKLATGKSGFGIYNVGTGLSTTIKELSETVSRLAGGIETRHAPAREVDIKHSFADMSKAHGFGFKAKVSLHEGLERTFRLFRK